VICFDEWGPLELKPLGGVAWARRRQPQRMRATYHRRKGTEQFLGFYDVHGRVPVVVEKRKGRILPVSGSTTNRPPGRAATGGMRHGRGYQEGAPAA
jgi:hypothetical protein